MIGVKSRKTTSLLLWEAKRAVLCMYKLKPRLGLIWMTEIYSNKCEITFLWSIKHVHVL